MHEILSDLIDLYELLNLNLRLDEIHADINLLEHEKFSLVVVGEFSRGKSTFINAMLGKKVLPSSKNPTTAVISKITYSDTPIYTVHYLSNKSKQITEEEFLNIKAKVNDDVLAIGQLKKMIGPTQNMDEIASVDIGYPLEFCKGNVEVVDTPGVNDLNMMRVDITYNYLRKADAAILVLSAAQVLTQSELTFLKEQILGNQIEDIFIVVNGKDQNCKNPDDEQRLIKYVKDNLNSIIKKEFPVHILSSKQALTMRRVSNGEDISPKLLRGLPSSIDDTGFIDFERHLELYLDHEQGNAKIKKYALRANKYVDEIHSHIQLQFSMVNEPVDDIRRELFDYQPKVKKAKLKVRHIIDKMKARMDAHEPEIVNLCKVTFNEMRTAAISAIDLSEDDESTNNIENVINAAIIPVQNKFAKRLHEMQDEWFANEYNCVINELKEVWSDLDMASYTKDDMSISYKISDLSLSNATNNSMSEILTVDLLGAGLGVLLAGAFPLGIGLLAVAAGMAYRTVKLNAESVKKAISERFNSEYDVFIERTVRQFVEQNDCFCKKIEDEVNIRIGTMEQNLSSIINMKEALEGDASKTTDKLETMKYKLEAINRKLDEVIA